VRVVAVEAMKKNQVCTRCIMDTTDPEITFDEQGHCNHCTRFFDTIKGVHWLPGEEGRRILIETINRIKGEGRGKKYDGIIGLSGGVDSSYLLYKIREWGLHPLAVHVDAGWDSDLAVQNIKSLCEKLDVVLHNIVIDWEAMRNVQVAFLRSGVINQEIPQDHAFFAALYRFAVQNGVRYVFHGSNFATESILPSAWGYDAMDSTYLQAIVHRYGDSDLRDFPTVNFWQYYFFYPYVRRMTVIRPLNYIPYRKIEAIQELERKFDWRYYGGKHWESRFSKFFQGYYLPKRFGFDKRKAHLSSLIVSGEITRSEALEEMRKPIYPPDQLDSDKKYVLEKLHISDEEFEQMLNSRQVVDNIPTNESLKKAASRTKKMIKIFFR